MYILKEGQIDRLLKLVNNRKHKLILLLMIDCGIQVSDCVSLKISDFDFGRKILKLKDKMISISNRCYCLLYGHISDIRGLKEDSYIFSGKGRKHICRKTVNKFLERLSKKHQEFCGIHPKALQMFNTELEIENKNSMVKKIVKRFLSFNEQKVKKEKHCYCDVKIQEDKIHPDSIWNKNYKIKKTFGRKKEIDRVSKFLEKGINVMILGGVGVGKSHLINCLTDSYKGKILRLDDCYEIKKSLINILTFLYKCDKKALEKNLNLENDYESLINHLQKDSISNLSKKIIEATKKKEYLLVIDNCDRITPRGIKIFEELKDHFCILTSGREVYLSKSSFLWNFEIVRLKNLERKYSLGLIYHLSIGMQIEDEWLFRNHVFEQSVGNPRVIFELIERYRKEVVVSCDIIREIRHVGSLKEYDCSWFVIAFLGILSCLRFMSHELGNDSLRFIGGCSVLGLLIFRNLFSKRRKL